MGWQEPDGWPQPVALRQLGSDLNTAVSEVQALDSGDFSALNRVQDVSTSARGSRAAVKVVTCALIDRAAAPQVQSEPVSQVGSADSLLEKRGLDVQDSVSDERVGAVVVVNLELPVAAT